MRDPFSTEKGDRQRVVVFNTRRRILEALQPPRDRQQHTAEPRVCSLWLVRALVRDAREKRNARRKEKPSSLFVVSDRARLICGD